MKNANKDEDLFHLFIQYADKIPQEAELFPYFDFMDTNIRKAFNQLKKSTKKPKDLETFDEFWHELNNEDKVKLYCNWVILLKKALELQKNISMKLNPQSITIQDQIYVRKMNIFNKSQKKIAKLTPTHLHITGNKTRQYELKNYQIKKSRGKDSLGWSLKPIVNSCRSLNCQVNTVSMFDQWFYALTVNINNQRVQHFFNVIKQERGNKTGKNESFKENEPKLQMKKNSSQTEAQKTLTQIMIHKQMQPELAVTQINQQQDDQFESMEDQNQINQRNKPEQKEQQKISNPNIFRRLDPKYKSLINFCDTPFQAALIHVDPQYRIYQLQQKGENDEIILKMFTVFQYPKSLLFQAIVSQTMGWNDQVDVLSIKTKISSQNSALIYQKNKAQGILYRERDFLYLRHCFSSQQYKQPNTFIIDKSIDSIHHPPFMSLVRAEKKLIWGLVQKQVQKQTILVIQGWIKGGGYMNHVQNKDMTLKFMKKVNNLKGFLKQLSFSKYNKNTVFQENWKVSFKEDDFVKLEVADKNQENQNIQKQTKVKSQKQQKQAQQMAQFIKRTQQQNKAQQKSHSQHELPIENITQIQQNLQKPQYIPPPFAADKSVIIPQEYLKVKHIMSPLQKPKKPKYFPHYKGHHLLRGQWQLMPGGGLAYIDHQKMKAQKKVLTYIIKRIGKNIFSGKGILNVSLPVDIFCTQSNIQKMALALGYYPSHLQKAATLTSQLQQYKHVIASGIGSSLIYLVMQKPFNPILGETFQCLIDGCPVYYQQVSHHPPIAAFIFKGRGYTATGCVQTKMDLSINSGTGVNEGVIKIQFQNGNTFYYSTPSGCLHGLTYGDRRLFFVGKAYYWTESGYFLQLVYNPYTKNKGFFGSSSQKQKYQGDQLMGDYLQGHIKKYPPETIKQLTTKPAPPLPNTPPRLTPIIPKGPPPQQPLSTHAKIYGRWDKYIKYNQQTIFQIDRDRYYQGEECEHVLGSDSRYREDIVYRRMRDFVKSQEWKEVLEVRQREDRKGRAKYQKQEQH